MIREHKLFSISFDFSRSLLIAVQIQICTTQLRCYQQKGNMMNIYLCRYFMNVAHKCLYFKFNNHFYIIYIYLPLLMITHRFLLKHTKSVRGYNAITKAFINTQIIKKYQKQLQKTNPSSLKEFPKTFQQKMIILNEPKTIQLLQVIEYGVRYKEGKRWLPIILISSALIGYLLDKLLPIRVTDRYFAICPQSPQYKVGYIFAGFNYERPFYLSLPVMLGVYQLSKFITTAHIGAILFVNCVIGNVLSQYLVNQRVSQYEVWENQRISFGEGSMLSILFTFWSYIGFKEAFTHLKSKIFLKAVPGIGVIRNGLPFGYICLFYAALQLFFWKKGAKNSEVVLAQVFTGILMGLALRRIRPILK